MPTAVPGNAHPRQICFLRGLEHLQAHDPYKNPPDLLDLGRSGSPWAGPGEGTPTAVPSASGEPQLLNPAPWLHGFSTVAPSAEAAGWFTGDDLICRPITEKLGFNVVQQLRDRFVPGWSVEPKRLQIGLVAEAYGVVGELLQGSEGLSILTLSTAKKW